MISPDTDASVVTEAFIYGLKIHKRSAEVADLFIELCVPYRYVPPGERRSIRGLKMVQRKDESFPPPVQVVLRRVSPGLVLTAHMIEPDQEVLERTIRQFGMVGLERPVRSARVK